MSGGRVEEDCLVLCLTANNQYLCKPEFLQGTFSVEGGMQL